MALAVGAWFSPSGHEAVIIRVLVAAAAAVACTGAVLLRKWDRAAGKRVADLTAARLRDEWRTDERIAELESDVEESRELRRTLETQLRAKRGELARLRGEHAELLRRYATAESERARALESRRQLAIEAATAPRAIAPPPANPLSASAFREAAEALRKLAHDNDDAASATGATAVTAAAAEDAADATDAVAQQQPRAAEAASGKPRLPVREHQLVPAVAAAVLPYANPQRATGNRQQGGFDFFGLQKTAAADDLADVIGDEAHAEHVERQQQEQDDHEHEVIDLTAHDDTEQLDVRALRAQSS
ncbi:hypothetical protein [Streptomyces humicola]|nr:hypothetical protein [Streptomyces humicola]